jgi:HSP20 family protein
MKFNKHYVAFFVLAVLSVFVFLPVTSTWSEEEAAAKNPTSQIKMVEPGEVVTDTGDVVKKPAEQSTKIPRPFSGFGFADDPFLSDDPFQMMQRMQDEMNRAFSRNMTGFGGRSIFPSRGFGSAMGSSDMKINMKEEDGNLEVICELPGMNKEELKIRVIKNRLHISGERKNQLEEKSDNYYRQEISHGSVSRIIPLPVKVDETKAKAEYKDGVLTITIPKVGEIKKELGHEIPIE